MIALLFALAAAPTVVAPSVVSTDRNEYNLTSSTDGSTVVFARSDAEFRNAKIMVVGADWRPQEIGFSDPRWSDTDPQISADGGALLFVSDRPLPEAPERKDLNLWRSTRTADGWSAPEPLPGVNSPGYELGVELRDGALTFNSTRKGGPGALDVWRAAATADGFGAPEPLPAPINSPAAEGDFTLSPDGRVALFWSDRPGGLGEGDLWLSVRDGEGWGDPVNLGPEVNSPQFDFTPTFSPGGRTLIFSSTRPRDGGDRLADVYAVPVDPVPALKAALAR